MLCLQDLKYKILVKGKKERVVEGCSSSCSDLSSSDEESVQAKAKKEDKKVSTAAAPFGPCFTAQIQTVVTIKQKKVAFYFLAWRYFFIFCQPSVSKLSPELSELVVYTRSVPFKTFEQAARAPATDMSSFSESDALRLIKDSGELSATRQTPADQSYPV